MKGLGFWGIDVDVNNISQWFDSVEESSTCQMYYRTRLGIPQF